MESVAKFRVCLNGTAHPLSGPGCIRSRQSSTGWLASSTREKSHVAPWRSATFSSSSWPRRSSTSSRSVLYLKIDKIDVDRACYGFGGNKEHRSSPDLGEGQE